MKPEKVSKLDPKVVARIHARADELARQAPALSDEQRDTLRTLLARPRRSRRAAS